MARTRCSTGIDGLDEILAGGLVERQNTLLRGPPGSGKTIVGLHFLAAGVERGETALFVNLGEPGEYVRETAEHFGLHAEDVRFHDLSPTQDEFAGESEYSVFSAAEVEQPSYVDDLRAVVEEVAPDRVLVDPITEFRYLTTDDHQFRRQMLSFLDFLSTREATVVLTSQTAETMPDDDLRFLTDAVVNLERTGETRTVHVSKFRGSSFRRGRHEYEIREDGVAVWPRLVPDGTPREPDPATLTSGVPELDALTGGGLDHGTVTLLSGPTGVGKTTLGLQFLQQAAADGRESVLYTFEESPRTLLARARSVGIPLDPLLEAGALSLVEVRPEEYSVGEFTDAVRTAVADGAEVVMLDGVQGFAQNLRGLSEDPATDLLRLGRYLRGEGVSTLVVDEVHAVTGEFRVTDRRTSNLADNVVVLRHVEFGGRMRKVVGVLKMRTSDFERTLRELEITADGLVVGEPLSHLRGILTGTPERHRQAADDPVDR